MDVWDGIGRGTGDLPVPEPGRVEDLEGSIDRCLRLSDLTTALPTGDRTPVSRSLPSISACLRVELNTKEHRTGLLHY